MRIYGIAEPLEYFSERDLRGMIQERRNRIDYMMNTMEYDDDIEYQMDEEYVNALRSDVAKLEEVLEAAVLFKWTGSIQ